jgi:hypothetical protein
MGPGYRRGPVNVVSGGALKMNCRNLAGDRIVSPPMWPPSSSLSQLSLKRISRIRSSCRTRRGRGGLLRVLSRYAIEPTGLLTSRALRTMLTESSQNRVLTTYGTQYLGSLTAMTSPLIPAASPLRVWLTLSLIAIVGLFIDQMPVARVLPGVVAFLTVPRPMRMPGSPRRPSCAPSPGGRCWPQSRRPGSAAVRRCLTVPPVAW